MALQIALFRHPGMPLAQVLQIKGNAPAPLVAFLARQLGLNPDALDDYATRTQTVSDHARLVAAASGLRPPTRVDVSLMIAAAERAAARTDAGLPIATAIIEALRSANIMLPMPSTIERAGIAGRARARKKAAHLTGGEPGGRTDRKDRHAVRRGRRSAARLAEGTTSSSDGQFFRGGKRLGVGDINARYGVVQVSPLYPCLRSARAVPRDGALGVDARSPLCVGRLLHHDTSLDIAEHYTDTGGATDYVFALCAMLRFRFRPRLRDFPDRRLAPIVAPAITPASLRCSLSELKPT